ncbi:MAG: O-antigen ligase family protein [Patescibacteria group bacterium]
MNSGTKELMNSGTKAQLFFISSFLQFLGSAAGRLAILSLPWQVRWFSDASLSGWPWEQGRASFYVSWFLILGTILFIKPRKKVLSVHFSGPVIAMLVLVVVSLVGSGLDERALGAIAQWWIQIALLILFVITLWRSNISKRSLAIWFVISLIPHAILGVWQFSLQEVAGHPWLGMASQNPFDLGVSVIELNGQRFLRAYGGFPHPNIFGGWAAMGFITSIWLAATARIKERAVIWSLISGILSIALFLTFARSAWLGTVVGILVLLICGYLKKDKIKRFSGYGIIALLVSIIAISLVAIPQRGLIFSRFDSSQRLETKSLNVRTDSLKSGIEIFRAHPVFGTGPNSELLDLAVDDRAPAPLETPHNIFVLVLANFGTLGFIVLLYLMAIFLKLVYKSETHSVRAKLFYEERALALSVLSGLFVVSLFDHYLWSLWSGQSLVSIILAIILL